MATGGTSRVSDGLAAASAGLLFLFVALAILGYALSSPTVGSLAYLPLVIAAPLLFVANWRTGRPAPSAPPEEPRVAQG